MQPVSKLLVEALIPQSDRKKKLCPTAFWGTSLLQISVLPVSALRKECGWYGEPHNVPACLWHCSSLLCGLRHCYQKPPSLVGNWHGPGKRFLINGLPFELFAFGFARRHLLWCTQQTAWKKASHSYAFWRPVNRSCMFPLM